MQAFPVCAAETEEGWSGEVSAWFILEKWVTAEVGGRAVTLASPLAGSTKPVSVTASFLGSKCDLLFGVFPSPIFSAHCGRAQPHPMTQFMLQDTIFEQQQILTYLFLLFLP